MMIIFLYITLGWSLGMTTALVIGYYASKWHDKEGDQDSNLFV